MFVPFERLFVLTYTASAIRHQRTGNEGADGKLISKKKKPSTSQTNPKIIRIVHTRQESSSSSCPSKDNDMAPLDHPVSLSKLETPI